METVRMGPALGVTILLLVVFAAGVAWLAGSGHHLRIPWASARAALQLTVLALIIGAVVERPWAIAAFLLLMVAVASYTAAGRVRPVDPGETAGRPGPREILTCALPVAAVTVVLVPALLLAGVLAPNGLAVIPVAGILIGNAMTLTSLTGRRAHDELRQRHGEVEAAVALGFTWEESRILVCREAAASAILPAIDSTRTVGMVTIPGAFVGMVLGGAAPWEAGIMQLFVLIAILAVGVVAMVLTTRLVGAGRL